MKNNIIMAMIIFLPFITQAQSYPKEVLPGKTFTVTATNDTLWIITDSQLEKCLKAGEKLEICKEINDSLNVKAEKQEEIIQNLQQNNKDYKEGYDRYKQKWEESDKEVERLEIKMEKRKKLTRVLCGISAVGSAILTSLVFILI